MTGLDADAEQPRDLLPPTTALRAARIFRQYSPSFQHHVFQYISLCVKCSFTALGVPTLVYSASCICTTDRGGSIARVWQQLSVNSMHDDNAMLPEHDFLLSTPEPMPNDASVGGLIPIYSMRVYT